MTRDLLINIIIFIKEKSIIVVSVNKLVVLNNRRGFYPKQKNFNNLRIFYNKIYTWCLVSCYIIWENMKSRLELLTFENRLQQKEYGDKLEGLIKLR